MGAKCLAAGTVLVYGTVYAYGYTVTCDRHGVRIATGLKRGPAFPVLECEKWSFPDDKKTMIDLKASECKLHSTNSFSEFFESASDAASEQPPADAAPATAIKGALFMDAGKCQLEKGQDNTFKIVPKKSANANAKDKTQVEHYFFNLKSIPANRVGLECDGNGCRQVKKVPTSPKSTIELRQSSGSDPVSTVFSEQIPWFQWSSEDPGCYLFHSAEFKRASQPTASRRKPPSTSRPSSRSGTAVRTAVSTPKNFEENAVHVCPKKGFLSAVLRVGQSDGAGGATGGKISTCKPNKDRNGFDCSDENGYKAKGGTQSLIYTDSALFMFPKAGAIVTGSFVEYRFEACTILNAFVHPNAKGDGYAVFVVVRPDKGDKDDKDEDVMGRFSVKKLEA